MTVNYDPSRKYQFDINLVSTATENRVDVSVSEVAGDKNIVFINGRRLPDDQLEKDEPFTLLNIVNQHHDVRVLTPEYNFFDYLTNRPPFIHLKRIHDEIGTPPKSAPTPKPSSP